MQPLNTWNHVNHFITQNDIFGQTKYTITVFVFHLLWPLVSYLFKFIWHSAKNVLRFHPPQILFNTGNHMAEECLIYLFIYLFIGPVSLIMLNLWVGDRYRCVFLIETIWLTRISCLLLSVLHLIKTITIFNDFQPSSFHVFLLSLVSPFWKQTRHI